MVVINLLKDIFKSLILGLLISLGVMIIASLICLPIYHGKILSIVRTTAKAVYFVGGLGLFLSACFFAQRDGTKPLTYHAEWREHFKVLNLPLVILLTGIGTCIGGMILQSSFGIIR